MGGVFMMALVYILTLCIFMFMNYMWAGVMMKNTYHQYLGHLRSPESRKSAIFAFYIIFTAGLFFFAISPGFITQSFKTAIALGSILGFVSYSTYNLTNLGTLKRWPTSLSIVDILWGTFVSGFVSMIGLFLAKAIL